jgi:hypothetical protein
MNEMGSSRGPSQVKISLILMLAIALTCAGLYLATFNHGTACQPRFIVLGGLATMSATILPIWLERWIFNGAAYQLLVVGWRMGTMLFALALASQFPLDARNCTAMTLLACYLVTLPLESWLLALRTR